MLQYYALEVFSFTLMLFLAACVFGVAERCWPARPYRFYRQQTGTDLLYGYVGHMLLLPLAAALLAAIDPWLISPLRPYRLFPGIIEHLPAAAQLLLALLVMDIAVYIRHRFMHERLWPIHAIHHSAEEITWLTKYRLHPLEVCIAIIVNSSLLFILGLEGENIVTAQFIFLVWDMFNHANIRLKLPRPISYVIATPHYHKWHHALKRQAINKNYVVMFPFIDKILGTYYCPDEAPEAYGMFSDNKEASSPFPAAFTAQLFYPFSKKR